MIARLYQIDPEKDTQRHAFLNHESIDGKIDAASYERVFDGEIPCTDLEEVYALFNINKPDGYVGHSMSVSDVVEIVDGTEKVKPGFYFCDTFGFKGVDFDPELVTEKSPFITVVLVEPGKLARPAEIDPSLAGLQKIVGGCIEAYYPFEEEVCIVCNDEGKIIGLDLNRGICGEDGELAEIIAGPFFICDCSGESFGSLSSEQVERYTKQFKYPEQFFKSGDRITAIPYEPKIKAAEERT